MEQSRSLSQFFFCFPFLVQCSLFLLLFPCTWKNHAVFSARASSSYSNNVFISLLHPYKHDLSSSSSFFFGGLALATFTNLTNQVQYSPSLPRFLSQLPKTVRQSNEPGQTVGREAIFPLPASALAMLFSFVFPPYILPLLHPAIQTTFVSQSTVLRTINEKFVL